MPAETSAAQTGPPAPGAVPHDGGPRPWPQRWFWLTVVLVALAALVIGGSVEHVFDQRRADRALYGTQLMSTVSRFVAEQDRQIQLPLARRSAVSFDLLSQGIPSDTGIDPHSTLHVELGRGSVRPLKQIAFEVTVSSPYASTNLVVWTVQGSAGPPGTTARAAGGCLLSSTLEGPGRAQSDLHFGGISVSPCPPVLWRPTAPKSAKVDLTLAGIPVTGRR